MVINSTLELTSLGHKLDPESFDFLRESNDVLDDVGALRTRFEEDGYLYIRDFLPEELILDARRAIFKRVAEEGGLNPDHDLMDGVLRPLEPGTEDKKKGFRPELTEDCDEVKRVVHGPEICRFYEQFFGEPIRYFDFIWARLMGKGQGTASHCDWVYMGRGSKQLMTCWIPYVDVPLDVGGLILLEKSHLQRDRIKEYLNKDVDAYCENRPSDVQKVAVEGNWSFPGWLSQRPDTLTEKFNSRWLTSEQYRPGDILTFRMDMIHGSLDNHTDRIRFSTDTRYQPASHPADERWVGANPSGHSTAGKRGRVC